MQNTINKRLRQRQRQKRPKQGNDEKATTKNSTIPYYNYYKDTIVDIHLTFRSFRYHPNDLYQQDLVTNYLTNRRQQHKREIYGHYLPSTSYYNHYYNNNNGDMPSTTATIPTTTTIVKDYRDVIVTRNIYESIISGYLYHKQGKECYLSPWKDDVWFHPKLTELWNWQHILSQHLVQRQYEQLLVGGAAAAAAAAAAGDDGSIPEGGGSKGANK